MTFNAYLLYKPLLPGLFLTFFLAARALAGDPALSQQQLDTLSDLLTAAGIEHEKEFNAMAEASQAWRRRPDQERWEVSDLDFSASQRQRVMACLDALGLVKEIKPTKQHFDYVLILGGTVPGMKKRFQHLIRLWNEGVRFDQIIFLTGQRPTVDDIDQTAALVSEVVGQNASEEQKQKVRPNTEKEAAEMVYRSAAIPEAMGHIEVEFLSTDRLWLGDRWQRGNTRDSIKGWVARNPRPGSTLVVTNQPHLLYQQEVIRQELPTGFAPQATAQQSGSHDRLIMHLDALALWLHNLQIRVAKQP